MKSKYDIFVKEPYHILNICFAGIIILIFIYSGIFSVEKNNHPIKSACATVEGHPCKSEGLSRSFSEIVRFRFESAKSYNKYGIQIFLFFLIQLFFRFTTSFIAYKKLLKKNTLVVFDSLLSVSLYIYCFWGIIT
jgi:hypothetical protein